MKRSEAILKIAECLVEPHYPEDSVKEAEYILRKLEKSGMLPPSAELSIAGKTFRDNYWEQEDENASGAV